MITVQDLIGNAVLISVSMIERVHVSLEAPAKAKCTIDLQSGKSMHVMNTFDDIFNMIEVATGNDHVK